MATLVDQLCQTNQSLLIRDNFFQRFIKTIANYGSAEKKYIANTPYILCD